MPRTVNGRKPRQNDATLRRKINRMSDLDVYSLAEYGPTALHRHIASQVAHARAVAESRKNREG